MMNMDTDFIVRVMEVLAYAFIPVIGVLLLTVNRGQTTFTLGRE